MLWGRMVADRTANVGPFPCYGDSSVIPVTQVNGVAEIVQFRPVAWSDFYATPSHSMR